MGNIVFVGSFDQRKRSKKGVKSKDRKFPNLGYFTSEKNIHNQNLKNEIEKINRTENKDGKYISY